MKTVFVVLTLGAAKASSLVLTPSTPTRFGYAPWSLRSSRSTQDAFVDIDSVEPVFPLTNSTLPQSQSSVSQSIERIHDHDQGGGNERAAATISRWKRRLFTKTDRFGSHKLSGLGLTVASLVIIATGIQSSFQEVPELLEPWTVFLMGTGVVQATSSVELAATFRRKEPGSGNVFLGGSSACLLFEFTAYWIAPFEDSAAFFDSHALVGKGIFAGLSLLGIIISLDALVNWNNLVQNQLRHEKGAKSIDAKVSRSALGILAYVIGMLPPNIVGVYVMGYLCDRPEYMNLLLANDAWATTPNEIYYQTVWANLVTSYLFLFVTLRDKGLINKDQALALMTASALPLIACYWNLSLEVIQSWLGSQP